jgi:hypothetical protein
MVFVTDHLYVSHFISNPEEFDRLSGGFSRLILRQQMRNYQPK